MKLRRLSAARLSFPLASAIATLLAPQFVKAQSISWTGTTSGAWLTTTNWTGGVPAGSPTDTANANTAVFNVNANNTVGINMNTTAGVYYLGAIDNTNATARTINNSSTTTAGVLTLNGATVNSVANTIVRNSTTALLTITNGTGSGTMGLALGNATDNIIQITGNGGITIPSIISGTGRSLTRQGTGNGVLILSGANTYDGLTTVSTGVVNIQNAAALGSTDAGTTVASGAALQIQNNITVGAEALALSGEGIAATTSSLSGSGFTTSGALRNISGNNTFGGAITLGTASRINSDTFATTLTLTGGITGTDLNLSIGGLGNTTISTTGITTGSGTLTKDNIGTLTLAAANTYTGTTTVLGGTLTIATEASLYNGSTGSWTAANINVKGGATLALGVDSLGTIGFGGANLNTLLANLSVANTAAQGLQSGAFVGIDTTNADGGTFTQASPFANSTGAFGGVLGLTKLGNGTLVLDKANTYTGPTTVSAGTLQLGSGGTGGTLSISSPITVASGATFAINRSDSVTQGTDFNAAPITGAGGFTQAGGGTTVLTAANTFTGITTVSSGVLQLDNALALQNSALSTSGTGTVTLGAGVTLPTFGGVSGATDLAAVLPGYSSVTNLTLNPQSGSTSTFAGIIANGAAGMTLTKSGAGTQVFSGANAYTGATIINGGILNLTATGSIASSTGLTLNNGALTLTNIDATEGAINRVSDTAPVTSNGGTINYTNTSAAAVNYAETLGAVDLVRGQLAFNLTNTQAGSQILTLADLTRTVSNTSTVSLTGGPNTTTSQLVVTSAVGSATPAGQIIGPWFNTNGTGAGSADYAVYNTAGQVVGSGTAPSTESTWTDAANAYTVRTAAGGASGAAAAERLATTRNMAGLRIDTFSSGAAATLAGHFFTRVGNTLANGDPVTFAAVPTGFTANAPYYVINVGGNGANTFQVSTTPGGSAATFTAIGSPTIVPGILLGTGANLGTKGILHQSGVTSVIAPGTGGVVTLPGTTSDNLFINTGGNLATGSLNVVAPIADNGAGVLTLVKSGLGTLTLSGANTYTGGTVLNAGTVAINNASSFGAITGVVTVNGDSRINAGGGVTYENAIAVNSGRTLTLQAPTTANNVNTTATFTGVLSGSGNLFLPNSGNNAAQGILDFTSEENTFTGNVVLSASGSGDEHFKFASIGDGGNFTFAKNGNRQLITYTGSTDLTFNTRQIVVAATMFGTTDRQGMDGGGANPVNIFLNDGTGTVTFTKDMVVNNLTSHYGVLYFGGSNSGDNTLSGNISDTSGSSKFAIGKFGPGKWILSGTNTYEGNTLIAGGVLSVATIANSSTPQPLGIGPAIQLGVGSSGANGTLLYTGGAASTDKQVQIGATTAANSVGGGSILNDGSGELTFTNPTFNPTTFGVNVSRTVTIGGDYTGATNTIQGVIQNNSTAGVVALAKTGEGTWKLSGANTYTGATTLNGGTLILSGSNSSAAATTIGGSGGTLQLDSDSNGGLASGNLNLNSAAAVIQAANADRSISNSVIMNGDLGSAPTFSGANGITLTGNLRVNNGDVILTNNLDSGKTLAINTIDRDGANNRNLTVDGTGVTTVGGVIALGAGTLTKDGAGAMTLSGANTYTGDTVVNAGSLTLADNAQLKFVLGASGINNSISGAGTVTLEGDFVIDTTAADALQSGTWILENVPSLGGAYGANFTVSGFNDAGGNTWVKTAPSKTYTFDEATGTLTLVSTDPFPAWAAAKGLTGAPGFENGKGDDPDGDGLTNLDEFAFDGNPLSGANDGKIVGKIGSVGGNPVMTLTLPVRNGATFANDGGDQLSVLIDGIYYRVEGSLDLGTFANVIAEVTGPDATTIQGGLPALSDINGDMFADWTYRTFRAPDTVPTVPRTFLRAKASETP